MSTSRAARHERDTGPTHEPVFVVQHHLATADHYDFRLEIDGVLVSWAVPKGPSTDPGERRMAIRTGDHPMGYETFERVVGGDRDGGGAGGELAGTVRIWDRGTWQNVSARQDEPVAAGDALADGHISLRLAGEKLRGRWSLIRTGNRAAPTRELWLLVKKRGEEYGPAACA